MKITVVPIVYMTTATARAATKTLRVDKKQKRGVARAGKFKSDEAELLQNIVRRICSTVPFGSAEFCLRGG